MARQHDIKLVEVFADELWRATAIKNLLEDNEIEVHLENGDTGNISARRIRGSRTGPVHVSVSDEDYDLSMELIEEFNNSESLKETDE